MTGEAQTHTARPLDLLGRFVEGPKLNRACERPSESESSLIGGPFLGWS